MSFLIYQRSDPRQKDWLPLTTQQIRLRNLIQIVGINLEIGNEESCVYFTLHVTPMSAPFFTSEKIHGGGQGQIITWKEIEPRQIPDFVRLSALGCIIRVWTDDHPLISWGVVFKGLNYLGMKGDWNTKEFSTNTILLRTPFGFFTSLTCLISQPLNPQRFLQSQVPSSSYKESYVVKTLAALHRVQRSVLEENELSRRLKREIGFYGYLTDTPSVLGAIQTSLSGRALLRVQQGRTKIKLKEEIEGVKLKVGTLREEKLRAESRVQRLKKQVLEAEDMTDDLKARVNVLFRERERLKEMKINLTERRQHLTQLSGQIFVRKKQLISELLVIYPMSMVQGTQRYSINEVQLPNAEDYGNESGGQISVALGYTAHMTAMLSFFLGIPLRYPVRHFGSRSRIIDHITVSIPDKEREFPLYFRGKKDVYFTYAVYLLNKNIAQLRWYCGLSTVDLRATLPNLYDMLTNRLIIPGWPPNPSSDLEVAQEITEESDQQLFRSEASRSLDEGLDQLEQQSTKLQENVRFQAWFRSSFSDLEFAGGNSVAIGEIKHGRAQDKFLMNGWKKKYESEVIDPKWLTNSLNLESDSGRRFSISASPTSPPPPPSYMPNIQSSDEANDSRKRRFGRVELGSIFGSKEEDRSQLPPIPVPPTTLQISTAVSSSSTTPSLSGTPAHNIRQLEKQIKEIERRKSFCDPNYRYSSGPTSPTKEDTASSVPTDALLVESDVTKEIVPPLPHPSDNLRSSREEKLDDSIADIVRKISLVEMELQRKSDSDTTLENNISGVIIKCEKLEPIYSHSSSSNEEKLSRSPSPQNMVDVDEESERTSTSYYEVPVPFSDKNNTTTTPESDSLLTLDDQDQQQQISITSSDEPSTSTVIHVNSNNNNSDNTLESNQVPSTASAIETSDDISTNNIDESERECKENLSEKSTLSCDKDNANSLDSDNESSSDLWFRTEALLNTSQSFNLVKSRARTTSQSSLGT